MVLASASVLEDALLPTSVAMHGWKCVPLLPISVIVISLQGGGPLKPERQKRKKVGWW
jgi:hypothetical protein